MEIEEIIKELKSLSNPDEIEGMARFGINPEKTYAVRIPQLRKIARRAGKDHDLAAKLWNHEYRETRIIASIVENPVLVSEKQMEDWALGFDTWDICDQCCMNLFRKTPFAYKKVYEWSLRHELFVKRAAFTLIATLAVHDKMVDDSSFEEFFHIVTRESDDERNYVKKAVNWALRQIGKRNMNLNKKAIEVAEKINKKESKSARWIAKDALRELKSEKVQHMLKNKKS